MEVGNGVEFLCNKTTLVTGATGFLAKVLLEKILRIQPNVKKLYLLIRVKDTKSGLERLHDQIIGKELFGVLRERHGTEFDSFISEKVEPIDGDTSSINLGLNDNSEVYKEIDVIIHSAALTKFQERYDLALAINTFGARNVVQYAKTCPKLRIFVHVSTAYVCRQKAGLILETPCVITDARKADMYGYANTYVFTKVMGEMLMREHIGDLPVVIVRPTMICSTYKEPFPCWIESLGSTGTLSVLYGKGLVNFTHADGSSIIDLIPADMVVNSIIMGMVANANKPCLTIYQVGSSLRNPLTLTKLVDINYRYFNENPWIDGQGMPVKIKRGKLAKGRLHFLMLLVQHIPMLMVLKLVGVALCRYFKLNQDKHEMQIKVSVKMAMIFSHYLLFAGM